MANRSSWAIVLVFGLLAGGLSCLYAAPCQPDFPNTAIGGLGRQLIEAINGDGGAAKTFVANCVSSDALKEISQDDRVAFIELLQRQSGGVDVQEVREIAGGNPLEIYICTRQGGHWVRFYAFADRREPNRLREYGAVPIRDPKFDREEAWPTERLPEAELIKQIDWRVEDAAARDEFSGTVLVAQGDRFLFQAAYGFADKNWKTPNGIDTKYNLASANKMFTAVAIGQLIEAGKLQLSDTLSRAFPEYPNAQAAEQITIDHLLRHRAGLGMLWERPGYNRRTRYRTHASFLPLFANEALLFPPGSQSSYSNEGFLVLGALIEKLSGMSYEDYVAEHIFEPAKMVDTGFPAIDDVATNLAVGYARFEDDPMGVGPRRPNWIFLGWRGNACGGGFSTAPDLFRFFQALRNGKLVGPKTLDFLIQPLEEKDWYARGFQVRKVNEKTWRGHGGGGPNSGIEADAGWLEQGDYTVIVLGNYDPPGVSVLSEGIVKLLSHQNP